MPNYLKWSFPASQPSELLSENHPDYSNKNVLHMILKSWDPLYATF